MNASSGLRFLRPYLSSDVPIARNSIYLRFFNTSRCLASPSVTANRSSKSKDGVKNDTLKESHPLEHRMRELEDAKALNYPRIKNYSPMLTVKDYKVLYKNLVPGEDRRDREAITVNGRVLKIRIAGKALVFLDMVQDGYSLQVILRAKEMVAFCGVTSRQFQDFYHLIRRGDVISVTGSPYATSTGEISISASELPTIISPSLKLLPSKLEDPGTRIRNRHVDLLVNQKVADTIRIRSHIIQHLREFLLKDDFLEVQTPIIADSAGGAIARPFTTVATEFSDKQLALRIAPEIWLKRLVLGGLDRVFEIGPAFRNEGLDATHNPEFTTCEFYKSYASLEDLIALTEKLLSGMAEHVTKLRSSPLHELPELDAELFSTPFQRIQFIPALEEILGEKLPDLTAEDAQKNVLALFTKHSITLPYPPTLPRLLDKLCSTYLEYSCTAPTLIMHHPACLAPLSKSFLDPETQQVVSARAELFIQNREVANMYEEENSPFAQRRKFEEQARWRDDENRAVVDESYLDALEWGLPPTGGWGCGIDRLCMLFSGAARIGDVLPFGSLKNVVNLGRSERVEEKGEKSSRKEWV